MYLPLPLTIPYNNIPALLFNHPTLSPSHKSIEKTNSGASTRRSSTDSLELNLKFKTELCKYYSMRSQCPFGDLCCFAHGEEELRSKESIPRKYKTKLCSKFNKDGQCPYGLRCQFIHPTPKPTPNHTQKLQQLTQNPSLFFELVDLNSIVHCPPSFLSSLDSQCKKTSFTADSENEVIQTMNFTLRRNESRRSRFNSL